MAKITLYFKDLNEENQAEIRKQLKEELKGNIDDSIKENPDADPETITNEVIESYINEHNFANEFKI